MSALCYGDGSLQSTMGRQQKSIKVSLRRAPYKKTTTKTTLHLINASKNHEKSYTMIYHRMGPQNLLIHSEAYENWDNFPIFFYKLCLSDASRTCLPCTWFRDKNFTVGHQFIQFVYRPHVTPDGLSEYQFISWSQLSIATFQIQRILCKHVKRHRRVCLSAHPRNPSIQIKQAINCIE